jgi:hypothetical protein
MSRFAGVKRLALIGCQQIYALPTATPTRWADFAPEGTRRGSMVPSLVFPIPLRVLATARGAREDTHD